MVVFFFHLTSLSPTHATWSRRRSRRCWRRWCARPNGGPALYRAAGAGQGEASPLIYLCRNLLARISRNSFISGPPGEPVLRAWDLWLYLWVFNPSQQGFFYSQYSKMSLSFLWMIHLDFLRFSPVHICSMNSLRASDFCKTQVFLRAHWGRGSRRGCS